MIKYFIKQYGRYIAMALAFATITFLINSCEVKAENEIQTVLLGYENVIPAANVRTINVFQSNNTLKNWGRGTLLFTLSTYWNSDNTSFNIGEIQEVNVTSSGNIYTCNIGTISANYDNNTTFKSSVYSVICDIVSGSSGIQSIDIVTKSVVNNAYILGTSTYMTFAKNIDLSTQAHIDQVNATLVNYLTSIYNANFQIATYTGATNNYLSAIQTLLATDLTAIVNGLQGQTAAINNQTQQQHQDAQSQKESTDAINNSINNGDTSSVSLDTITGQSTDVGAISGLITIPLTLLSSVITAFNGTCVAYNVGTLFNTNIVFPCINLQSILGSFLWDTIDILISGIFIFYISKKFIILFNKLINLENIRLGVVDFV